jgi:hypothetical protein
VNGVVAPATLGDGVSGAWYEAAAGVAACAPDAGSKNAVRPEAIKDTAATNTPNRARLRVRPDGRSRLRVSNIEFLSGGLLGWQRSGR